MRGSAMFVSDDEDDFGADPAGLAMRIVPTAPGRFRGRMIRVDCQSVLMSFYEETLPRIAHLALAPDTAGVLFPIGAGPSAVLGGITLEFGTMAVLGAGHRCHFRTPADFRWAALTMRPERLATNGRTGQADLDDPDSLHVVTPPRADLRRLLRLCVRAARAARTAPDILRAITSARGLEDTLVEVVSACIAHGLQRSCPNRLSPALIMNAMEDLLAERRDRPVGAAELSAALNIPARSLRLICHQHLGTSPGVYLRLKRLSRTRRELERADPATSLVRDIATRNGFSELGRFAIRYREWFGESPSATLRRFTTG